MKSFLLLPAQSATPFVHLDFWDYSAILLFLVLTVWIARMYAGKNRSLESYFRAEGRLPWFVAGTAMVATTFAADTPLAVTELVADRGIWGNWTWWYMSLGTAATVFIFSPLWKRSGVLTDLELISLRYRGTGAEWLRAGKAIYLGGFMNVVILAWVNLAMLKILESVLPVRYATPMLILLFGFGIVYTILLGLGGISYIDVYQFFFAMGGCILLAVCSVNLPEVGGLQKMQEKLPNEVFDFFPPSSDASFLVMILFLWWASWYPGSEPGGGGYIAQRILSSRSEKEAFQATLWFLFAHYFIRPWPWILVALCSAILFPDLPSVDKGKGFIYMIEKSLSSGWKGILIAGFIAAYLSTVATHLNWGASYLINDLAKPYVFTFRSGAAYLRLSYWVQALTGILSLIVCFYAMERVSSAWFFLIEASSGVGFALVFRWFWWRIHAWSELTGFVASPLVFGILKLTTDLVFPYSALVGGMITIAVVILVTYLFPEKEDSHLREFCQRVKPPGPGWGPIYKRSKSKNSQEGVKIFALALLSVISVFSGLGCIGIVFFGEKWQWLYYLAVFLTSSAILFRSINRMYSKIKS